MILGFALLYILLFFIVRFVALWYFRINEHINLIKEQNLLMRKMLLYMGDEDPDSLHSDAEELKSVKISEASKNDKWYPELLKAKFFKK